MVGLKPSKVLSWAFKSEIVSPQLRKRLAPVDSPPPAAVESIGDQFLMAPLDVLNTGEEPLPSTTAEALIHASTTAEHAEQLGLPRITTDNAAQHPPPSLNAFRTAAARAPADSKPAVWFWQMTGNEWPRDGHSFELEKKRHRRMVRCSAKKSTMVWIPFEVM